MKGKMKGSYILIIKLPETQTISFGKNKENVFKRGYYAYVGSAMNGIKNRINYHLKKARNKKMHWHIDYLSRKGKIIDIFIKKNLMKEECKIAKSLNENLQGISGFGSTDCSCKSHLFYSKKKEEIIKNTIKTGMEKYHLKLKDI
ncbi:MAG: GIY-YIG nuclease family protein [Candidatus Thermoplasmatota archaeon]